MFAEVLPFNQEEYIARRKRLGVGITEKPKLPKQVIKVSEERKVHVPALAPEPDPTIIPSLDKTLLVPADQWKIIFEEVCVKHNVPPILIRGKQRSTYIVRARHELAWRLAHETSMSLPQIASKMGYEDHTTLYNCFKRYKQEHGL